MKSVDVAEGLREVLQPIEQSSLEYMIVGSIAGSIYGEPRLTRDLDLVVAVAFDGVNQLHSMFDPAKFYIPPKEIFSQEIQRAGQVNLLHHASGLKVDLVFRKSHDFARTEFERRRRLEILHGLTTWVAAPEDVIIGKLLFYHEGGSGKHLTDIRGIIANTTIDQEYLQTWISRLHLEHHWRQI